MVVTLKVESSNKTKHDNYCNKLQMERLIPTEFGQVSTKSTFYLFTDQQNEKGKEAKLELDLFDQITKPVWLVGTGENTQAFYNVEDMSSEQLDGAEQVNLKYLYPKRGE